MIFWLIAVFLIFLYRARFQNLPEVDGCFSRERSQAVNGFFALFILLTHARMFMNSIGYSWLCEPGSRYAMHVLLGVGQLCVVPFLFFSGYGIAERSKGNVRYVEKLPKRRILSFYLNSLPVALLWVVIGVFMPAIDYPKDAICQLIFWRGIDFGPCWYNFCIIAMYFFAYIGFKARDCKYIWRSEAMIWILSIIYVGAMSYFRPEEPWWFNTALAFPLGVSFSCHRLIVFKLLTRKYFAFLFIAVSVLMLMNGKQMSGWIYNFYSMVFALLLVLVMMRVRFGNYLLSWIGSRVFPIYMYHLFFYKALSSLVCKSQSSFEVHVTLALSFASTIFVAWLYPRLSIKKVGNISW